jgi:serine phosphatase RsbU (regulator of sigma subunit)
MTGCLAQIGRSIHHHRLRWRDCSIRWQLLCIINTVVGTGLLLFILADYRIGLNHRIANVRALLQEEAELVLAAVESLSPIGPQAVQEYLDAACARVRSNNSVGHQIAARVGTSSFQGKPHNHESIGGFTQPDAAAVKALGEGQAGDQPTLLGAARSANAEVLVSVYTANVLRASRRELLGRAAQLLLLGVLATAILNLAIIRLVVRPVRRFVEVVRGVGRCEWDARVGTGNSSEFAYLAGEINSMSASLADAEQQRARQMGKARRIQEKLQPTPINAAGWRICGYARPAEDVGGDFLDYRLLGHNRLIACVGDVAGHGIPAAIAAAIIKMLYRFAMDQSREPAEILRIINATFSVVSLDEDFASMFVLLLDLDTARLTYASAGHETGYLMRSDGGIESLDSTGLPLGIDAQADWSVAQQSLEPGDRLVLLTDGWPEAAHRDGRLFGRQALLRTLKETRCAPEELPQALLTRIKAEVGANPSDDLTLVVIDRGTARFTDKENATCGHADRSCVLPPTR